MINTAPSPVTNSQVDNQVIAVKPRLPSECDNCLRGGWPLRKELLSFALVLLVGACTVLAVLLINEKRESLAMSKKPVQTNTPTTVSESTSKKWEMPAEKTLGKLVALPQPDIKGKTPLETTIQTRRSRRTFAETPVTLSNMSQILWSAQGITDPKTGHRTAPSGMSGYPFTVYVLVRNVEGVEAGLYQYLPEKNQIGLLSVADASSKLNAAGVQDGAQKAPAVVMLVAAPAKTAAKLKTPSDPMTDVLLEAGHIGQNMYLEVESLEMSMVVMGGFDPAKVGTAMQFDKNEEVVYIVPVGNRATEEETEAASPTTKPATE